METNAEQLIEQVRDAASHVKPLRIVAGNSKAFYGNNTQGEPLNISGYRGIISYEPTELYITARAGTPLIEVEQALAGSGQMLAFDPPRHTEATTIGGVVACGLSGPRRPYAGAARDFILGITCINGRGQLLRFGGQVMKNVAGYDLSRLLTGSFGTLGVILDITLKVLPVARHELTCTQNMSLQQARQCLATIATQPYPVSAAAFDGEKLYIRLSGKRELLDETVRTLKMDVDADANAWWQKLRDHRLPLFETAAHCWRLSLPVTAQPQFNDEGFILDWGGAQYWLASNRAGADIFQQAAELGGSATLFKTSEQNQDRFQPLPDTLLRLHRGLKDAFDPQRILNPGRMYATL
ncbi:MAG: glycolate oxidase subunit GlcE [Gammaproteobacteria bacterium]